ncbi:TVP38/TMEM64 family protein [Pararhodobacter sp. SW119]|uniref:TVP38/TMEM64 family protein n=1 Tax=Pararhodobacter sp. SW119 TaxID=2780075 RepID=UPI001AE01622|nr:TVP38/TMEM64 family protein [Pararhodobacter sp. SW119]
MQVSAKSRLRRQVPLLIVVLAAVTGAVLLRDHLSFEALRANREALLAFRDSHYLWAALVFVLTYVGIVALSLPGATVATLTGGFLFGLFPGGLFNVGAATVGAVLIFLAVRSGLGDGLRARIDARDGAVKRISDGIRRNEVPVLIGMRLVPVLPFFIANLLPAFIGVATVRFAWTTFVGILPGGLVYTWVGAGLGEVFARGETPNLGIIFEPHILGPLLGLAALALLPVILRPFAKV